MNLEEYNKCVDNFSDNLYRFLLKNIRNTDKAKDLVQDAFEILWLNVDKIKYIKAKTYLFTTGYNKMINTIRKEKNQIYLENEEVDIKLEQNNVNFDVKEILNEAVNKLSEAQKQVVLLRYYEGCEYKEIAEITGYSIEKVKIDIHRAKLFLKNYIVKIQNLI